MTDSPLDWHTSSHSGQNGQCVAVAQRADGTRLVRNSKRPNAGTAEFTPAEWKAFVLGVRDGEFD